VPTAGRQPRAAGHRVPDTAGEAKKAALRLLAVKPRTRAELARALTRKGFEAAVVETVLDRLERARLIDDAEYAEMMVRSRYVHQGLGRAALRSRLEREGVDKAIAQEAVEAIDADAEEARARELVRKRLPAMTRLPEDAVVRRLLGMLARKGYPEDLALRVVREELAEAGRETALLDGLTS